MPVNSAMVGQRVLVNVPVAPPGYRDLAINSPGWHFAVGVLPPKDDPYGQHVQVRDDSEIDGFIFEVHQHGTEPGQWLHLDEAPPEALHALPKDILVTRLCEAVEYINDLEAQVERLVNTVETLGL